MSMPILKDDAVVTPFEKSIYPGEGCLIFTVCISGLIAAYGAPFHALVPVWGEKVNRKLSAGAMV